MKTLKASQVILWKSAKRGWGAQKRGRTVYAKTPGIALRRLSKLVHQDNLYARRLDYNAKHNPNKACA